MVSRADASMLPRLKRIWQTCFDDTPQATEFVFSGLLHPDQMLVQTGDDGRPAAMINWKLLRFTTPRGAMTGAYVFGVATLPEYRGRGISRTMMSGLHDVLKREGAALSCLVPASSSLFGFYADQGFETFFSYKLLRVDAKDIPRVGGGVLSAGSLDRMEGLRNAVFSRRSLFGAWDAKYLQYTDRECRFYGGETLRFSCGGRDGYAVCVPREDGSLLVKEAVVDRGDLNSLLSALHIRYGKKSYQLRLPEDFPGAQGEIRPFAMIRWYDEKRRQQAQGRLGDAPWFAFGLD